MMYHCEVCGYAQAWLCHRQREDGNDGYTYSRCLTYDAVTEMYFPVNDTDDDWVPYSNKRRLYTYECRCHYGFSDPPPITGGTFTSVKVTVTGVKLKPTAEMERLL